MSTVNEETLASCRADAYDEARMERNTYEGEVRCQECGCSKTVRLSLLTDEPYYGFECDECESDTDWEHA